MITKEFLKKIFDLGVFWGGPTKDGKMVLLQIEAPIGRSYTPNEEEIAKKYGCKIISQWYGRGEGLLGSYWAALITSFEEDDYKKLENFKKAATELGVEFPIDQEHYLP